MEQSAVEASKCVHSLFFQRKQQWNGNRTQRYGVGKQRNIAILSAIIFGAVSVIYRHPIETETKSK